MITAELLNDQAKEWANKLRALKIIAGIAITESYKVCPIHLERMKGTHEEFCEHAVAVASCNFCANPAQFTVIPLHLGKEFYEDNQRSEG